VLISCGFTNNKCTKNVRNIEKESYPIPGHLKALSRQAEVNPQAGRR
jgi:hypothetical protein